MTSDALVEPAVFARPRTTAGRWTAQERRSVGGMAAFVLLLHVVGWGVLIFAVAPHDYRLGSTGVLGVGVGLTAYMLGVRHAFDADHIASIDNTTRKLVGEGRSSVSTGFWFSLGHSSVVFAASLLLVAGVRSVAGVVQDTVFGPLVAFGPGGVLAELIGEAAFRIAPLTDVDAEELVLGGKAGRLVRGFRGAPPADAAALVDLVLRLGALGEDVPAVAELDLNPVLALPDGAVAVDARVRVRRPEPIRRTKAW